jgi:two-component sensor histidine kinase
MSADFAFTEAPPGVAGLSRDLDDLAQTLAEREAVRKALALEVHHRVKNNLQIVTSLLNMQANRIENPAAREALGQTRARIGGLALIHRILYEQADDGSHATLDIGRLIPELCSQFRLWNMERPEIAFSCRSTAYPVPLDSALPLVLFAVEAVTNAYAYAFPEGRGGSVVLRYDVSPAGDAEFAVKDDGIGFDAGSNDASMGRLLMLGFARQLAGKLVIESGTGAGTEVRLEYRNVA